MHAGRAGGAAFGVGFADDDGQATSATEIRRRCRGWSLMSSSCLASPMRTWPLFSLGWPLAWKAMKSIGRSFSTHVVQDARAGTSAPWGCRRRRRYGGRRPGPRAGRDLIASDGGLEHLAELRDRAGPVVAVGLVPALPRPGHDLLAAVALDEVLGPGLHQVVPFLQIVRRRGPAGHDRRVGVVQRPAVPVGAGVVRQRLGREGDLDEGRGPGSRHRRRRSGP